MLLMHTPPLLIPELARHRQNDLRAEAAGYRRRSDRLEVTVAVRALLSRARFVFPDRAPEGVCAVC